MTSSIAVLNTTLNRPMSAREGKDDSMVVHKVSLVSSETPGNPQLNGVDKFQPSTASPELQRRWKNLQSLTEEPERSDYIHYISFQSSSREDNTHYTAHVTSERELSTGRDGWEASERSREESVSPGALEREIRKAQTSLTPQLLIVEEDDDDRSSVFQATRVELDHSPTDPELPVLPPSSSSSEIDSLVDTLKSMERPLRQRVSRTPTNNPFCSLPPIEEDAPDSPLNPVSPVTHLNGSPSSPLEINFSWSTPKEMRSPMTMMKEQFGEVQNRGLLLPSRASALNSIVMRRGSMNDAEDGLSKGVVNGANSSRLENSFFFQGSENANSRSMFRAASLPDIGSSPDRISLASKPTDAVLGSRFERFSFLTSPSSSLTGLGESSRISVAPFIQSSSSETLGFIQKSPTEAFRALPLDSLRMSAQSPALQRSNSLDGGIFNSLDGGMFSGNFHGNQKPEQEQNLVLKYRAFPDAYLTKEKEHGKLNPRPGKLLIFDKPGFIGERIEVRGDVVDATPWEFTDTISVRVIRGGWVFYEKPDFKGEKIALDEGEVELTDPFCFEEEEECAQPNGNTPNHVNSQNGDDDGNAGDVEEEGPPKTKRKFVIGSIRRAVRDYSVPEISLFPEENAEGKKVTFRDTSEDARIFGLPIKANSVIINAGLWLVFAEPFFQGVPRVLEVGGFSSPSAWGVTHPYVASLHPLKIGEPRVEDLHEPRVVLYEKPYFTGKSREIRSSMRDFLSRTDNQQTLFMFSAGSIKVLSGCWVGFEKEGFRGHQYLLEEGEYHDWRVWGGVDSELRSIKFIQADLSDPELVLFAMPNSEDESVESPEQETFEVTEAVADVELFGFGTSTRSIHVISGAWVAYSHVDFSGCQFVLEKGFYSNCGDWGASDNRICSLQPILTAPRDGPSFRNEVLLYSEVDFKGSCRVCHQNQESLPENLMVKSCRVVGGSWVLYGGEKFSGEMCVLSEGDFPNRISMGLSGNISIRSVRAVPLSFSLPSVSLFGLECFEGREVTLDVPLSNLQEEGFSTHFLSVRVNSGCWVLCEYSNFRGQQFLLEPIEITNWQKFSNISCIGSLYPVRQKQRPFRIRNKASGLLVSVQGGLEEKKSARVVVSEEVEGYTDVWVYQDGLIKNKRARNMSLQVMGQVEPGAKLVLWAESRVPVQTWSASSSGFIQSLCFHGMVLDVKGGQTYDKNHLVIREESEEVSQQWELEFV